MRRLFVAAVAATTLAAVVPAGASARHTHAHLAAQHAALQAKFNTLSAFVHNCLAAGWVPITGYGDPAGSAGYLYDNDGEDPTEPIYTGALDITTPGDKVTFYVAMVNRTPRCLGRINARARASDAVFDRQPRRFARVWTG